MKTVVLDDDPTGTQSASNVEVLFSTSGETIADALRWADSVYVQTNSRALSEDAAVTLARSIRAHVDEASVLLDLPVQVVLRGDSTLRGHVFAETAVFEDDASVMVFVPAFPEGGRTTVEGVHLVDIGGVAVPAGDTEYARDPVFPFTSSRLTDYVGEKSGRPAIAVAVTDLHRFAEVLRSAPAGSVVVPDAVTASDIGLIAAGIRAAVESGTRLVVRCAAPLAAELADVASSGLLATPLLAEPVPVRIVCGSHTSGATAQLAELTRGGHPADFVDTDAALDDPQAEGERVAEAASRRLATRGVAVIASQRERRDDHNTLDHGEKVMEALVTAVQHLLPHVGLVISKGGITSAEIAANGIGADSALVVGQIMPGVSVWRLRDRADRELLYVIVPGNVGGQSTILDSLVSAVGRRNE
ncbi:four-carbon acid sugar kinase family protein [soil metagenome]